MKNIRKENARKNEKKGEQERKVYKNNYFQKSERNKKY